MALAAQVATRATCDRKHVGAVIVQDNHIISTGYNGAPPGQPHCDDVGHDLVDVRGNPTCVRCTHAELNALLAAAKFGNRVEGSTMYITHAPCKDCAKAIITAGVQHVVCPDDPKRLDSLALLANRWLRF